MEDNETFKRRSGTVDLGKSYEDLLLAYFAFKLTFDDTVRNFQISSNNNDYGSFDDIVLEIDRGDGYEIFAIQAKHYLNKNVLSPRMLTSDRNFNLLNYFEQTRVLNVDDKVKWILFTNLILDHNEFTVTLSNDSRIRVRQCNEISFLQTDKRGIFHQFTIEEGDDEEKKFFDNVYLFSSQLDARQMEKKIFFDMEMMNCDNNVAERYLKFMRKWNLIDGKNIKMNKRMIQKKLGLELLSSSIYSLTFGVTPENVRTLQEAVSSFQFAIFDASNASEVVKLWGDYDDSISTANFQIINRQYQLTDKQLGSVSKDYTQILWLLSKCPLIIRASETTVHIIQMLHLKNIVFLEDRQHYTVRLNNNHSVFRNLSQLASNQTLYNQIIQNFVVRVNKDNFSLHDLHMMDLYFKEEVTTDDLIKIAFKLYSLEVERKKIPKTYISRSITRNLVTLDFLDQVDSDTIIMVDCINRNGTVKRRLQQKHRLVDIEEYLSTENATREDGILSIYYSEATCTSEDFVKIRQKNGWSNQCHHLRAVNSDNKNLEWIRSANKINDLQKFRTKERTINEEELCVNETQNKINLINGESGMGKSELLKNLKNNSRSLFSIYMHSKETSTLFSILEKTGTDNIATIIMQIIEIKFKNYSPFQKKLLEILFYRGDIVFFWDALDEVCHNLNDLVRIISKISTKASHWITCRTHLTEQLERDFCALSRTLCRLTDDEQTSYIMKRIENFVETDQLSSMIEKIKDALRVIKREETPLQMFMITEIVRQNLQQNMYLLDKVLVETDLYNCFLSERFDSCFNRAGISLKQLRENNLLSRILRSFTDNMIENYMKAALKVIIPEISDDFSLNCDGFLSEIAEKGDYTGIIAKVKNGQPQFIHMSYAEYFVAAFFAKNYEKILNFEDVLFKEDYNNIRFFFDTMLAKDSTVHKAVLYKNVDLLKQHKEDLEESVDDAGRSVLHLACSWGQRHPVLNVTKENDIYFVDDDLETSSSVQSPQDKEMIELLLEVCDLSKTDGIFNYTPIQYAQKTNCPLAMLNLLQKRTIGHDVALQLPQRNRDDKLVEFKPPRPVTNFTTPSTIPKQESDDGQDNSESNIVRLLYYASKYGQEEIFNIFDYVPFIKTSSDNVSILQLALKHGHENFVWGLLQFDKYRRAINERNKYGETLLYKACEYGYEDMVSKLIDEYNAILDIGNDKGYTILHVACQKGYHKVVEKLLNYEMDVNGTSNENFTPLHLACLYGHLQVVVVLIRSGAAVDSVTMDGSTPLHLASSEGFGEIVQELIKQEAKVNAQRNDGTSPLHAACENGHITIAKMLITAGADLEQNIDYKCTPLHKACANGYYEVAQLLIEHEAKVNRPTKEGNTPLHMTCCGGYREIAELLVTSGADFESYNIKGSRPIHEACSNNFDGIVTMLIEKGAERNIPDNCGKTPLHIACEKGFLHTVQILLDKGVEINVTDTNNYTPLHLACQNGNLLVVDLLLDKNADAVAPNKEGWTPLHTACSKGFEAIIRSLSKKVNIDILGSNNWTPLHKSCQQGPTKIVGLLLELGANANLLTMNEESVLYIASENNRVDVVDLLIEKNIDLNTATKNGWTALHVASDKGFENVVRKLLEARVDVNKKTGQGHRAIALASRKGHEGVIQILTEYTERRLQLR